MPQPEWIKPTKSKLLKKEIINIIKPILNPEHRKILFNTDSMQNYWIPAFTHKSVNYNKNYETLEFYGDTVVNHVFAMYIRELYNNQLNQHKATLLSSYYMSEEYQATLSEKIGLVKLVNYDEKINNIDTSIKEDIFEAFFGALNNVVTDKIFPGMGYTYCYNFMVLILSNQKIMTVTEIQLDPVTRLKELYEGYQFGIPKYVQIDMDRSDYQRVGVAVLDNNGIKIAEGFGKRKKNAKRQASLNALEYLKEKGMNVDTMAEFKKQKPNNPEYDKALGRANESIEKLNIKLKYLDKPIIKNFKLTKISSNRKHEKAFTLDLIYDDKNQLAKTVSQISGAGSELDIKIQLLNNFADSYIYQ